MLTDKQLPQAQLILKQLSRQRLSLDPGTRGMADHNTGLLAFYRGEPLRAIALTRKSLRHWHPFRRAALVNMGIFYGRIGKLEIAERYLRKAIHYFSRSQDLDWLAHAMNNLGLVLKQKGEIQQARECYSKSAHLSRAGGNQANVVAALENIAVTYSLQGRTSIAIRYHQKAAGVAVKARLETLHSFTLTNAGLQYAIQGRLELAIRNLKKAAEIRKKHGLISNLAGTYEYLGITCYLARRHAKAGKYLQSARDLFAECKLPIDSLRAALYAALLPGEAQDLRSLALQATSLKEESFELGLWKYVETRNSIEDETARERCRLALHEAERIFRKAPALFWLAAVHELKASYYLKVEHLEKAALSLQAASNIYLQLGARKSLLNLAKGAKDMKLPQGLLDRMMEKLPFKMLVMVRDILKEKNPEKMIHKILATALEFTDMERAVLILAQNPPKIFRSTALDEDTIREICEISYSAVESASSSTTPFVCLNASQDKNLRTKNSILANRITSVVCLPLRSESRTIGYLYLDSREGVETLVETESVLLEIFASIISIGLDTNLVLEKSLEEIEEFRLSLGIKADYEMIGNSKPIQDVMKKVHPLISSDIPVLITGETGTGKDLIARILHYSGKRKEGPFVILNCSALSESLLENELFGHEKGAFTGAFEQGKGLFEQADEGTVFLDEVGDMPRTMQSKLLRVLQDGEFRRIGGSRALRTNARIVLATNKDVEQMLNDNEFRKDLYFRITGAEIRLPALRDRKEDIPVLASFFLKQAKAAATKKVRGFLPETLEILKAYSWPGNVRELQNEVKRIVAYIDHNWVLPADLDARLLNTMGSDRASLTAEPTLREMEREFILQRLAANNWNIVHTARSLGLTRNGLYSKMRAYNIPRKP